MFSKTRGVRLNQPMTWVSIFFQYKGKNKLRPSNFVQEDKLQFEAPYGESIAALPIPAVGDSVSLHLEGEGRNSYKVLTRHFAYLKTEVGLQVTINIVVVDIDDDEMAARLKE